MIQYLGVVALLVVLANATRWFQRAWRVNVPDTPYLYQAVAGFGLVLGVVALIVGPPSAAAGWAIGVAALFLYLTSTGAQKAQGDTVEVGDTLPSFTAVDKNGDVFDSASLSGSRVLLKFFRGHW
jgi:hypothetical protein